MLEQCVVECIDNFGDDMLDKGKMVEVKAHPMDRNLWYSVSSENDWTMHDRWRFDFIINQYAVCEKHYGLFQLPILETGKTDFTVVLPSGYVNLVSKENCRVEDYTYPQRLNCGDVRFR